MNQCRHCKSKFFQGLALAIAWLIRNGDADQAEYIMNDQGLTVADFRAANIDKFDMDPIEAMFCKITGAARLNALEDCSDLQTPAR